MKKIEVQVIALSSSETSPGNFSLVLEDPESSKRIPIIVGGYEAQAIAVHLERMQLLRPITHDLMKNVIQSLGGTLKEIFIHSIHEGIFHASLVLTGSNKEETKVDARASDAIALSIRFDCPIYVSEALLAEAGLVPETNKTSLLKGSLAEYSIEELESLLKDVLAKEDYESATRIRDMIRKRTSR